MEKMPIIEQKPLEEKIKQQDDKKETREQKEESEEERYRKISAQATFEMMYEERNIFSPEIQAILEKKKRKENFVSEEKSAFDLEMNK